jgi:hypothetical protein
VPPPKLEPLNTEVMLKFGAKLVACLVTLSPQMICKLLEKDQPLQRCRRQKKQRTQAESAMQQMH